MPGMTDRDHFAAAALTGFASQPRFNCGSVLTLTAKQCYELADAMLRERCRAGADCPGQDNAPNLDAAPAARADSPDERPPHAVSASGRTPSAASRDGGTGDTQEIASYARFVGQVMSWISEATSAYASACSSDGGRKIMAQACSQCWDAFDRIAYPTDHGASPEARASVESVAPQPTTRGDSDRADKAAPRPSEGTGDTPATHATHGEGSVRREGTEPAAWYVRDRAAGPPMLFWDEERAKKAAFACGVGARPLYLCQDFSPKNLTLTDAEREAVEFFAELPWARESGNAAEAAVLRGLLERLGGWR